MITNQIIQKLKKTLSSYSSLLLLFQRSPLVQMLFPEANFLASSAALNSTNLAIATVVGLGAYDSVAGATTLVQVSPSAGSSTVPVTSGVAFTGVFQVTSPSPPQSWAVSSGTLPAGLTLANNPGVTTTLSGTTTEAGDKVVTIKAWEFAGFTGPSISKTFTIRVSAPAAITTHPASKTIASGTSTTLTVVASGTTPLTYQWYQGTSPSTTTPVGTNSASFTTPTLTTTTNYWVKVTNTLNPSGALSNTATVTVGVPAAITTHPASTSINSGQSTTLSVIASGDAPLTYQWYQGASGTTTTPVGTNSASFTTPTLATTTSYWVKVTNALNLTGALSNTAIVTVQQPATITTHPASTTINSGQSTTLSVVAGGDAPFTYQWYQGASGTTTTPVGTNANSFTTPVLSTTTSYWVKVTNAANLTGANSNTATITVQNPAAITTHPASTAILNGQSTMLSVVASGDAPLTYQWYQGTSGVTTTPVGTNADSFTTPTLNTTTSYWVKVTNAANLTGANSNTAIITVQNPAAITTHPASATINGGQNTTLSVVATGDAPLVYQWYQGSSGVTTTPVGTDSASFTTPNLISTTSYWVKVTNLVNPSGALSNTATITVQNPAVITTHPASTTINNGQSTTLSVVASGDAPLAYQWYQGTSGVTTTPVGTNSASFTTPTLNTTTSYWVKVTNSANSTGANSNAATVTVLQPAAITTPPASISINSGQSTTLSVVATGDAPLTYQWYQGTSGVTTTPVGTDSASFTTPTLITTTSYWVKVTNSANPTGANSSTATVTVRQPAAITTHPASTTINGGQSTTLSVIATGDAPFTYQWYQGVSGTTTTPVGTNAASFTTPTLTTTTSYWVKVTNAANLAGALSNTATVTVQNPATITTQPASTIINSGQSTTLSVVAAGDAPLTYQWYQGTSGVTTTPVGTDSASFTTPVLTATTSYWVKVTNPVNPSGVLSNTATVTVLPISPPSAYVMNQNAGLVAPSSRGLIGTTWFGWETFNEPAARAQPIDDSTPDIGTTTVGANFQTTNSQDHVLDNGNLSFSSGTLAEQITVPTSGTVGSNGFTTLVLQIAAVSGSGAFPAPITLSSINGVAPTVVQGLNSGGDGQLWAMWDLPGNQASYLISISGAPGQANFSFDRVVVDTLFSADGYLADSMAAVPPSITTASPLPVSVVAVPLSKQLVGAGGTAPYQFSVNSGTLPTGLTLSTSGLLSGTPTAAIASHFTVLITDVNGLTAAKAFDLTITTAPSITTASPLPVSVVNIALSQQLAGTGGTVPYQFMVSAGTLPAGLTLSTGGLMSGIPTATGTNSFTVLVTDANGLTATKAFDLNITTAPSITTASPLPVSVVNVALSQHLAGTGGTAPYQFTVSTGTLPAGLALSTSGLLSGTPTATGTNSFTVLVTDANGLTATKAFDLTITTAPSITTVSPLPVSVVNVAFNQQLAGTGGTAPYQFTVSAGTLPTGLTLSTSGLLSGTPTSTGTSNFTVLITDANGLTATKAFDLTITTAPSITTASPLPVSVVNVAFNQQLAGTGGTAPYQFTVSAGTLPTGLTLSAGGLLSGTPTVTTTSIFTVLISDANGLTATKAFNLTITTAPVITTASPLPVSVVNVVFNQQLAGTGGTAPYQFTVSAGTPPAGLSLSTSGLLSGTPTATGTSHFSVLITDANNLTTTKAFDLVITTAPSITTSSPLPVSVVDVVFSQQFAGTGGTAPYQFTLSTGTLPAGLTLSTGGLLSGTPTTAGTSHFTVLITDANSLTATKDYDLSITTAPLITTSAQLAAGFTGTAYSVSLAASGGTAPYAWSLSSGTLPAGLSLSGTGVLSGTPTVPGTSNFVVQVQDNNGFTDTETYSVTMRDLAIVTTTLPTAVKGQAFNHSLIGAGTSTPLTWVVTSGTLPAGITLSTGGVFSGTPTTAGSSIFTVRLSDSTSFSVSRQLTLVVSATFLAPVIRPIHFPPSTIGSDFGYTVAAENYPKTFAITGLPKGLKFVAATGEISGIPTVSGVFNVQVKATNTGGTSAMVTAPLIVKALDKNLVGTFGGLISRDTVNRGLGGTWTVITTSVGSYTIKLTTASGGGNASTPYSITTGSLKATAPQISVLIGGQTLALTFNATTGQITGTHGSASVSGTRSVWNAAANPAEKLAGYYSMALDLADVPDKGVISIPQGTGFATFSVSLAGGLTVVGKTADGEGITSASFLGANGEFWAYAPLYKNTGSIQGPLSLSQDAAGQFANNVVSGVMTWFKPANASLFTYPAAFGPLNVKVEGGYLAPASTGSVVLGLPDAGSVQLRFTDGGLAASATDPDMSFTYSSDNKVVLPLPAANPGKVTLAVNAINPATGVVAGTFALAEATPPTRGKVPFQGQVVRMTDGSVKAVGYFMLAQIPVGTQKLNETQILSGGFRIVNGPAVLTVPTAVKDLVFNHSLIGTGGTPPYTWALSAGALPAGITLSSAGVLSGTPTATGSFLFSVTRTDDNNIPVIIELTLTVSPTLVAPVIRPIHFPPSTIGTDFGYTVAAENYPKTFAITGLPKGLKFVAATGEISGIPTVSGVFNVQVKATNTGGTSAMVTAPLIVKALDKNLVGTFGGLISRDTVNHGLGGTWTVITTSVGSYTIKLTTASGGGNASTPYSITTGSLKATAPQISVLIGGQTLALTFNATTGQITGTHGSASVSGTRSVWNAAANPAEKLAGYYSMALDLADVPDKGVISIPQGTGFATFSVSLAGGLTVVGKTADGEGITSASFLGANGEFWAYAPLYKNTGSIQGPLSLSQDAAGQFANNVVSGVMTWFKPANASLFTYPAAFGPLNVKVEGGYLAPASTGSVVLGLPDAGSVALSFTDGGLAASATDPDMSFTYTSDNKVVLPLPAANPGKVTLAVNGINANTGVVAGTFALAEATPPTRGKVPFQGQVVRMTDGSVKAVGYFMLPQILTSGQTAATVPSLSGGFRLQQPVP